MARRARQRMRSRQRDLSSSIARRSLLSVSVSPVDLRVFEDRRVFHPLRRMLFSPSPLRLRKAGAVTARVVEKRRGLFRYSMSFDAPKRVLICVRRKRRREVLHAKRQLRSGGAKRRNEWSKVEC